jgi:hypothetical protein
MSTVQETEHQFEAIVRRDANRRALKAGRA